MEVSLKQRIYLNFINDNEIKKQCEIATYFGITRVTAHKVIESLEEKGLLNKTTFSITKSGHEVISERKRDVEQIEKWLLESIGIDKIDAKIEAITILFSFKESSAQSILDKAICYNELSNICSVGDVKFGNGVYKFSAKLLSKDETYVSMGDQGIEKPVLYTVDNNKGALILQSKSIRYKGLLGKLARGSISKLWVTENMVEIKKNGDKFLIPSEYIDFGDDYAKVYLKIQASCGIMNMPISNAVLRLEYKD